MTEDQPNPVAPDEEPLSDADAELEARLAEGVLQGDSGIETAQAIGAAFVILVVTLIAFSNTMGMAFTSIDRELIADVDAMHNVLTVPETWAEAIISPAATISLALDWTFGGGDPFLFRLVSLIIHAGNAILLFLLARRLTGEHGSQLLPATAGLLFAVHPAVTESVNLLANRGLIEGVFFLLLSCVLFLRAAAPGDRFRSTTYAFSLVCFAIAFAFWPLASVGALLLPALDYAAHRGTPAARRVVLYAPIWLLAACLWIALAYAGGAGRLTPATQIGLAELGTLLAPLVYPPGLSAAYPPHSDNVGLYILLGIAVVAIPVIWRAKAAGVALFWFAVTLAAFVLHPYARNGVDESALYLPLAGLALFVPLALQRLGAPQARLVGGIVVAALIVGAGGFSYVRNLAWNEEIDLWMDARADCPTCAEPLLRLGDIFIDQGEENLRLSQVAMSEGLAGESSKRREIADSFFRRARSALDDLQEQGDVSAAGWVMLGTVQRYQKDLAPAEQSLRTALEMDPNDFRATLQMALLTEAQAAQTDDRALIQQAIELYGRAGQLGTLPPEILIRYAGAWQAMNNNERSVQLLQLVPPESRNPTVQAMMTGAQQNLGERQGLQAEINRVTQANPDSPEIVRLAARQLFLQGSYLQASYLIESIFRQRPPDRQLWYLLGVCRAKMESFPRFLIEWPEPPFGPQLEPWRELARQLARTGEWNEVQQVFVQHPRDGDAIMEYSVADIALELNDQALAATVLQGAADKRPADPEPWLRLASLAIAVGEPAAAQRFLGEAETRGAAEERVAEIRDSAGLGAGEPTRTIIE